MISLWSFTRNITFSLKRKEERKKKQKKEQQFTLKFKVSSIYATADVSS